jgi:amidase
MKCELCRRDLLVGAAALAAGPALPRAIVPAEKTGGSAASGDYAYGNAADLVRALAAKQISSLELTDAVIARIEALDQPINAVVVRDFDRARQAAKAADALLARGATGALLGLPMTVKELFGIAGLPTTWGNPKFRDWTAPVNSLVITRLKAAGAVILVKTNVPFLARDYQSYNEIFGTTNNPWDLGRTPGGSSGGAAAALAAGFVALELGSDIVGSLRCPAHFCGVFAHKPSLDLVPLRGAGPPGVPPLPVRGGLAVAGPMARSAADLALELGVIAGPDELSEGVGYKLALPPARHQDLPSFRVLVVDTHPLCPTAVSVRDALDQLADRLGRVGAKVARASPLLPDLAEAARVHFELLTAGRAADLPADVYHRIGGAAKALPADDDSLAGAEVRGFALSHRDWILATRTQGRMQQQWRELAKSFDVVLCPATPTPAFPHDHASEQETRRLNIDGKEIRYRNQMVWSSMATLLGLPATVAPIGHSAEGLPIGVQIIGPSLEDRTTIAFAGLVEREFGGFIPPPRL